MRGRGDLNPMYRGGPYLAHGGHDHPWAHVLFFILLVLVIAAVVLFLYRLATRPRTGLTQLVPATGAGAAAEALNIVRLRYARGEIKRDEFLRMSADFGAAPEPATGGPTAGAAVSGTPDSPAQ